MDLYTKLIADIGLPIFREATVDDVYDLMMVQQACYPPSQQEDFGVFQRILERKGPNTCFVAILAHTVVGYVLAHPHRSGVGSVPRLHEFVEECDEEDGGGVLFIHDLAVFPAFQGRGIASQLYRSLELAASSVTVTLVAVNRSADFWSRHGFVKAETPQGSSLESYGDPSATFMIGGFFVEG